jgi:hypothetical protein
VTTYAPNTTYLDGELAELADRLAALERRWAVLARRLLAVEGRLNVTPPVCEHCHGGGLVDNPAWLDYARNGVSGTPPPRYLACACVMELVREAEQEV